MTCDLNNDVREFAELIGSIGAAWGLPQSVCQVHALLYLKASPVSVNDMTSSLGLSVDEVEEALSFLVDYEMAWARGGHAYEAHLDPWEAMLKGLDQRRGRDLPVMKDALVSLRARLAKQTASEAAQVDKMITLVDDLSAIHTQAFRVSPRLLRGVVGLSGRAARFLEGRGK